MRIRHPAAWLVVLGALGAGTSEARAHFLFARVGPFAEGGRHAEVYFSERAEAGDAKFVDKIAGTRLWSQAEPGVFCPLDVRKGGDRLRALLPDPGTVAVVGVCEYGVLARPGQTPFLLRHYPKAVAGVPAELNALGPRPGQPLEVVPTFDGDRVRLVLLRDGRPVPDAAFSVVAADLKETKVVAGADGRASWTPPNPGAFSIYARDDLKRSGTLGGVSYEEIRKFATLALDWPLVGARAEDEAVARFEGAIQARAQWRQFTGFQAEVRGALDGRAFAGTVTVGADGDVEAKVDDDEAARWLADQLGSLALHRKAPDADGKPAPRPVLRFGERDDEAHPLGRLLLFDGGKFASSYRVKDRQILVVNRRTPGARNMTITVLDNDVNTEGKFLPRSYLVQYWDGATGALDRVETVQERWGRVGAWDLPTVHTVATASGAGYSVRTVTLAGHRVLNGE